ncbi:MAG TPA: 2-isopropylmalate synthase [Clostridia bacterium]|jgi:2-isopropylmalate synthase
MRRIKIFDTTLRDGEQSPGCSMHINEKIEIALQLEKLGVDIIEAGFAVSSEGDFKSVQAVAQAVKNCTIASLSRCVKGDIDASYNALKDAASPRLHLFLATSPLHMQYKLKMTPEQVLERIEESVKYAKTLVSDIEFSAEDAARSDPEFLAKAFSVAIKSGATVINVPDTVGYSTPQEMKELVEYLIKHTDGIEKVDISAHNHNDLGLACANSLAMVLAGASQIECTINGIGERAGNTSLEEVVMAIKTRESFYNAYTKINTKEIYRTSRLVSNIIGVPIPPTKPIVGANAFAHESGVHQHAVLSNPLTYEIIRPEDVGVPQNKIVLGKHSGRHAFVEHLKAAGYDLSPEEIEEYFAKFKALADKKKYVSHKDIEALMTGATKNIVAEYELVDFNMTSGKNNKAAATITIKTPQGLATATESGNGPVDSAYLAIKKALKKDVVLFDFHINSITEGQDALGEATVKLSLNGNTATGRGVSTDVLEAAILAFIDGINKLQD